MALSLRRTPFRPYKCSSIVAESERDVVTCTG
jgi:hypothetical protein